MERRAACTYLAGDEFLRFCQVLHLGIKNSSHPRTLRAPRENVCTVARLPAVSLPKPRPRHARAFVRLLDGLDARVLGLGLGLG